MFKKNPAKRSSIANNQRWHPCLAYGRSADPDMPFLPPTRDL
jgi:hypothetical protein